ncbi:MAG: hypothetical protein AAF830_12045 [Pseudomonadota bacterium]
MTRIETIFGGVLAMGILGVFMFVFFGEGAMSVTQGSATTVRTASFSAGTLLDPEEYVTPQNQCECYNLAYELARRREAMPGDDNYESQLNVCYDKFSSAGAAAFEAGYTDFVAEPRRRKSCPVNFR